MSMVSLIWSLETVSLLPTLVVKFLQTRQGPQHGQPVLHLVCITAWVLCQPQNFETSEVFKMAQLWETLDVVPPQVELGQMLTVANVLQRGYVIGTKEEKWRLKMDSLK